MTLKQQIIKSPREIIFRQVPIPKVAPNSVLIKIKRIGICGSDIHVYHGKHPNVQYPVTQGHEVSGIVEKVGKAVKTIKPGDLVTIQPQLTCGQCYQCLNDQYHICDELKVMGFQASGAASEYFVTEETNVIKLPKNLSYEQGAMIEPVAVACSAVSKVDSIKGKNIIVLGGGPIGNLTAQVAKALGAKKILITEISEYRRKIADEVNIDVVVDPTTSTLEEKILDAFGSDRADIIFECVGISKTIEDAIAVARKGTNIILVGVYDEKPKIDLNRIQNCELTLIGVLMYQRKDFLKAIELIEKNLITLEPLMSNHFAFEDYKKAYEFIEKNSDKSMKVFIDIE